MSKITVNQERLVREFIQLVSFDSESFQERAIADYLKKKLEELGLEVSEDHAGERINGSAGNIYGFLASNVQDAENQAPVLFSAHMDTVQPGIGKKALRREDGTITSDGTTVLGADDAAGLAEILEMLRTIREYNLPHPDIEVLFPVAEEFYAKGSRVFDYAKIRSKRAYVLDLSGPVGRAAVAAPSIISLKIRITGKKAHAGFCPEAGVHAIVIAGRGISRIPNGHVDTDTTVNLGTIQGGTARNIVPDLVEISGEIRSMDHKKALAQAEKIRRIFEEEAMAVGGTAEVESETEIQAYRIQADEQVVTQFQAACQELGLSGELEDTFGGSDNNHFATHGIRGIVVANAMNEVHTTKEYTSVPELTKAAELILKLATI